MRRFVALLLVIVLSALSISPVFADKPTALDNNGNGRDFVTESGFDGWGYNYRAHLFSGDYCDAYKGAGWCQPYVGTTLIMKWNEAWLSASDLNGDGLLDRHYSFSSYIGSGAWITNHMSGEYEDNGQIYKWVWFVKIVAKPTGDYNCQANGSIEIWGDFCQIESVYNDQGGYHGIELLAPPAGLGAY